MNYKIFCLFILSCMLFSKESQTFKLENGTKIIGYIISENESVFEVETEFGLVQIEKNNIKKYQCKVFMNNGNILVGNKISSSKNELILNTDMGVFKIKRGDYFLCVPSINNNIYIGLMFVIAILK